MRIKFGIRNTEQEVARSELVLAPIRQAFPGVSAELVTVDAADPDQELAQALLMGRVDFTIHAMELLPQDLTEDLPLVAYARYASETYALVLAEQAKKLPAGKPIGCFTPLQQAQLRALYPQHESLLLTDPAPVCLRLFHTGAIGGLVLDRTQIEALDLTARVLRSFTPQELIPPACSGILAVRTRRGTDCNCLKPASDLETAYCALAERAFLRSAAGDPALTGAKAWIEDDRLVLTGVTAGSGEPLRKGDIFGNPQQAAMLGEMLAAHLE